MFKTEPQMQAPIKLSVFLINNLRKHHIRQVDTISTLEQNTLRTRCSYLPKASRKAAVKLFVFPAYVVRLLLFLLMEGVIYETVKIHNLDQRSCKVMLNKQWPKEIFLVYSCIFCVRQKRLQGRILLEGMHRAVLRGGLAASQQAGHQLASQVGTHRGSSHWKLFVVGWEQWNLSFEMNSAFIETSEEMRFVFSLLQQCAVQSRELENRARERFEPGNSFLPRESIGGRCQQKAGRGSTAESRWLAGGIRVGLVVLRAGCREAVRHKPHWLWTWGAIWAGWRRSHGLSAADF